MLSQFSAYNSDLKIFKRTNIIIKTMGNPRFDRVKEKSDALKEKNQLHPLLHS